MIICLKLMKNIKHIKKTKSKALGSLVVMALVWGSEGPRTIPNATNDPLSACNERTRKIL